MTTEIIHEEIVYLPIEVYSEQLLHWYDETKDDTIIISNTDFIMGPTDHELTYTMDDIKRLNVKDFIIMHK